VIGQRQPGQTKRDSLLDELLGGAGPVQKRERRVSGVPGPIISAWTGHADLSMAARVYIHPSPKDLEQGRDALNALLGGKA
jgi:hypothetical protein